MATSPRKPPRPAVFGQSRIILTKTQRDNMGSHVIHEDSYKRKTKIIATLSKKCNDTETLRELLKAGMNVARLSFSHETHEGHVKTVQGLREVMKEDQTRQVAIIFDVAGGRCILTGSLKDKTIHLAEDQELILTTDYAHVGDRHKIGVSYADLPKVVTAGQTIHAADGNMSFEVLDVGDDFVKVKVLSKGVLHECGTLHVPEFKTSDLPILTEQDIQNIQKFAIPQGCDFLAVSYVHSSDDIKLVRKSLGVRGRNIKIIAKIEDSVGVSNFDDILKEADAIMIVRGALGMEIGPEKVFLAQKFMITKCNHQNKPVITATEMLESMVSNPRPTRAEASDVANAVLDGTDCVMLDDETAMGNYPVKAVDFMRRICVEAEDSIDYRDLFLRRQQAAIVAGTDVPEAVCSSSVESAIDIDSPLIIALTETGYTARLLSKFRPSQPILAVTASELTARQLLILRGAHPMLQSSFQGTEMVVRNALQKAKDDAMIKKGDQVIAVHGLRECSPEHTTLLKIVNTP